MRVRRRLPPWSGAHMGPTTPHAAEEGYRMPRAKTVQEAIAQFHASFEKTAGCWEWTATRDTGGYGYIYWPGEKRARKAHRQSWRTFRGPIPDDLWVLHHCDNPPCVNPSHLFLGTSLDNNRDRHAKGRDGDTKGIRNGRAVLDASKVRKIRMAPEVARIVAARYGVSISTVHMLRRRETWKHI